MWFSKITIAVFLVILVTSFGFAQDKVHLKNGSIIEGKVTRIEPRNVTVILKSDNSTRVMVKSDIKAIVYEDGSVETFNNDMRPAPVKPGVRMSQSDKFKSDGMTVVESSSKKFSLSDELDEDHQDYISRMFIAPNGRMLTSGHINLAFGGAYASQGGSEYLGLISIGLGGVAEFEISTSHIVTNIFDFTEPIGTTALKFVVYRSKTNPRLPTVSVALRSNRWSTVNGSGDDLAGPATPGGSNTIYEIDFKAHLTSLYTSVSADLIDDFSFHAGVVWHDVRVKEVEYHGAIDEPDDSKDMLFSPFGGIEHKINSNTYSMFEFGSHPRIEFNDNLKDIEVEDLWYGMLGIRYYVSRLSAIDAGIRYRSDYSGLADMEIRAGLNLGIDLADQIKKNFRR